MTNSDKPNYLKFGKRHILVLGIFTGFINVYVLRVSINTAIVSMVKPDNSTNPSIITNNRTDVCPVSDTGNSTTNNTSKDSGELDWDHETRGVILSSFFYGYICTQFIGGYLPQLIGGRLVFGVGVAGTAILTILNPVAARLGGPSWLIAARVLAGLFQGISFSCSYYLLGNWVPKQERSTLVVFAVSGANVGVVVAGPLTGLLCEYGFDGGWPSSFYVWGAVGLLWCIGWFYFIRDSPAEHPTISPEEREYIEANCQSVSKPVPITKVPWKSFLLSGPVWAVTVASIGYTWNYYTMLTEISTYLKDVLHISKSLNGVMASIPYVCLWVTQMVAAFLADVIRSKGVPTKWVRKVSHVFGMFSSSIILICITYAECNSSLVIVMICVAVGINGFGYAGFISNHMDIAPQYVGLVMGFANTFGQIAGIISPIIAGKIVNQESTITTWQTIWYISAGISICSATFFAIFADGEVQKWAVAPDDLSSTSKKAEEDDPESATTISNLDDGIEPVLEFDNKKHE